MAQTLLNYETMVVLNAGLVEDEREALVAKLRKIIVDGGADLKQTALWGKRRLAYPIEKRTEGYYVVFYYQTVEARDILVALERTCRFDENVMRYMSLRVPMRKRGLEVSQLVPTPGWLANFKLEPRAGGPRRRPESAGPPYGRPPHEGDQARPDREGGESRTPAAVAEPPAAESEEKDEEKGAD